MVWLWVLLGFVVLLLVPFVVGLFLPEGYEGHASARLERSPEEIWEAIHDPERHPMSGRMCKGIHRDDGRDASSLPEWTEDLGSTKLTVTTREANRPRRCVREMRDAVVPMSAKCVIEIQPDGRGSRVTYSNATTIRSGTWHVPIFRFIMTISHGVQRNCENWLKGLEKEER
ncbi:MAG: SRPBCC family protein [Planctomycetes bacterium]|nr:SRPBCC family protein [Planctomycetota bacterium]